MASDLRLPQRDINVKWIDGVSISTQPIPVEIKSADITLNVTEIAFGYVGIEDQLGNKLVINADGSINVAGGGGVSSSVSVTSSALPTGAATDATVASGNTTLTGIHTDTTAIKNSLAGTIAVSGTFWQATQPVSGTFWQATQPVSIASMPSTPVTGTFWQATQPVSGTFWQATQPVSGTFWQALQAVSIADGLDITQGARTDAKSTATDATPISVVSILKQISASVQSPPAQAVSGTVTVSDTGTTWGNAANRTVWSLSALLATGATTETVLTLVANANGVNAAGSPSYTVPASKTLRITSMYGEVLNTTTVANRVTLTLRGVPVGTAIATSPVLARVMAASQVALAASGGADQVDFPEGITIPTGWSICVSQLCSVTTAGIVSVVITGYIY